MFILIYNSQNILAPPILVRPEQLHLEFEASSKKKKKKNLEVPRENDSRILKWLIKNALPYILFSFGVK